MGKDSLSSIKTKMVSVRKTRNTYCTACQRHTLHKITQYKRGKVSDARLGNRKYKLKQKGFGGQKKPVQKRKYKVTKIITLKLVCIVCGRKRILPIGRCKSFKFLEVKKSENNCIYYIIFNNYQILWMTFSCVSV